jgi:hypothetical protein
VTCYTIRENGEVTGALCGKLGPACAQCGAVSEVLCDFPIGEENRTCDKPLCLDCAPEVGVNKNYCTEHNELGPGLLLFRRPKRPDELVAEAELNKKQLVTRPKKAKPIPKAPEPGWRWRVLYTSRQSWRYGEQVATAWMQEVHARESAARLFGTVQTWDEFVIEWRKKHPLKRPPRTLV